MKQETTEERPTLLYADDQAVYKELFLMILDKLGYNSILAEDGQDALEKAGTFPPALVFLDLQMPKMNGFEAAKTLRDRNFKNPIIAVTAGFVSEEWENCQKAGIDDILIKPFKPSEAEKMIQKWISAGKTTREAPAHAPAEAAVVPAPYVFNSDEMLENFMHNEEAVLPLLSRFIERTGSQLENILVLKDTGEWESARRAAHTIKGAAFTMGGAILGQAAARLEQACKNCSVKEVEAAYPTVSEDFINYKKEAEDFIRSRS